MVRRLLGIMVRGSPNIHETEVHNISCLRYVESVQRRTIHYVAPFFDRIWIYVASVTNEEPVDDE